ncbi:hypothetical protein GBO14_09015 [Pseudoalteromonas shioyasakiensis]|uniref:hypothetical protein n=1 Tax=Pseudoalteromonas shioyasakiensis TaxID=1190813 RepID=UPI002094E5BB|nr:hypothetical protein [Pseudoalteromonas shioyasakiensis]MCO6354856.1 hypothetical protein [Pseudoalteromonas shioyasakiensis]
MQRSRKHMLEGQVSKSVQPYSIRFTFRVTSSMLNYVKHNVEVSGVSRNRWFSNTIIAFSKRISSPESPTPITEDQINEDVYGLIEGTKLPSGMKRDNSLPLLFTDEARDTANSIARRYSTQLTKGESVPKDFKSKLMLIILIDHMLRNNYSENISQET